MKIEELIKEAKKISNALSDTNDAISNIEDSGENSFQTGLYGGSFEADLEIESAFILEALNKQKEHLEKKLQGPKSKLDAIELMLSSNTESDQS